MIRRSTLSPRSADLWALITTVLAVAALWEILFLKGRTSQGDFSAYWVEARVAVFAGWSHIYDADALRTAGALVGIQMDLAPQLPSLIWLVSPLAWFSYPTAVVIWSTLLATLLVLAWAVSSPGREWRRAAYGAVALVSPPVALAFVFGQASILVLAAVAVGYALLRSKRPVLAGLAFSAIMFKPHIAFLVPAVLLITRELRALAAFIISAAAGLALSVLTVGTRGVEQYISVLMLTQSDPARFFVPSDLTLSGLLGPGLLGLVSRLLIVASVIWLAWRNPSGDLAVPIGGALVGSLLVIPYSHVYDLAELAVAAWLILRTQPGRAQRGFIGFLYAAAALSTPAPALVVLAETLWLGSLLFLRKPAGAALESAALAHDGL